jgi:hypothetical protein
VRFRRVLQEYQIDAKPVFDLRSPRDARLLDAVVGDSAVEGRDAILGRLGSTGIVTDDNMLTEWHPTRNE